MRIAQITDIHWRRHIGGVVKMPQRASHLMPYVLADTLGYLRTQKIDFIAVTGDLIEAPDAPDPAAKREYEDIRRLLDDCGIPYAVTQGNHDDLDALWSVFERHTAPIRVHGYEIHAFQDEGSSGGPAQRPPEELKRFRKAISQPGQRNQIHIQHYVIAQETKPDDTNACVNGGELFHEMTASKRVLLALSGHKHRVIPFFNEGGVNVAAVQGIFAYPYTFAVYDIDEAGKVRQEIVSAADVLEDNVLLNPYKGRSGSWLKANLHTHCSESSQCSSVQLLDSLGQYAARGYSVIAVTDHNKVTKLDEARKEHPQLTLIPGYEYPSPEDIVVIGEAAPPPDRSVARNEHLAKCKDAVVFVSHPGGPREDYWTADTIAALPVVHGLEIYNAHYEVSAWRKRGFGWEYTAVWDELLSRGRVLWGFANDDYHDPGDMANACDYILASSNTERDVLAALKAGTFYASSGLELHAVHEYRGHIAVSMPRHCTGRFIGPGGNILSQQSGCIFEYYVKDEPYVRFEAEHNGRKLWLQPFVKAR